MAGSKISATDTELLPKCWRVSIQAAAAPVKITENKLCQGYKRMLTRDCNRIKVREGDTVFEPTAKGIVNIEVCWCSSRTIKCFDRLGFRIVKQTKCISNSREVSSASCIIIGLLTRRYRNCLALLRSKQQM